MIATLINAAAIILGSLIGLLIRKGIKDEYRKVVFTAAGLTSLAIGIQMVLETDHILSFALALMVGGLLGTAFDVEGAAGPKTLSQQDFSMLRFCSVRAP